MKVKAVGSVIAQIRAMITRSQKIEWLLIALFASMTSLLEVAAAFSVAGFVQVVNKPERVIQFAEKHGVLLNFPAYDLILYSCFICASIYVVKNLFAAFEVYFQNKSIQRMSYLFRSDLLQAYSQYCYQKYIRKGAVTHLEIFGSDIDQMFSIGITSLASLLSEVMVMLFLLSFLFYMNAQVATGIILISGFVIVLVVRYLLPLFYRVGKSLQSASEERSKVLHHFFHGFKEVVVRGNAAGFVKDYRGFDQERARIVTRKNTFLVIPRLFLECLFMLTFVGVVWSMVMMQQSSEQIVAVLGSYLYIGFRLMPGINRAINYVSQIKTVMPNIDRVYDQFKMLKEPSPYQNIPDFSFEKSMQFEGVHFYYGEDAIDVIKGVSFEIKKGESIGIIGKTGSGKSTVIDLMLGLIDPTDGKITIDSCHPVSCQQWHRRIGLVPQSVYLFNGSIKDNITFSNPGKRLDIDYLEHLIDCCELRTLIERLPEGLDTVVGESGVFLSGGERQRIAIARALFLKPDVLIFDEATSSLDTQTEQAIIECVQKENMGMTIVMVAHRLTTLSHCDKIIHIENGKKIAEGSYKALCL